MFKIISDIQKGDRQSAKNACRFPIAATSYLLSVLLNCFLTNAQCRKGVSPFNSMRCLVIFIFVVVCYEIQFHSVNQVGVKLTT